MKSKNGKALQQALEVPDDQLTALCRQCGDTESEGANTILFALSRLRKTEAVSHDPLRAYHNAVLWLEGNVGTEIAERICLRYLALEREREYLEEESQALRSAAEMERSDLVRILGQDLADRVAPALLLLRTEQWARPVTSHPLGVRDLDYIEGKKP